MEYKLDIFSKTPQLLVSRLSQNCRNRRLEMGLSRRTLSQKTGIPAPTIEHFERTGKISLESFCKLVVFFDYYDEAVALISRTKYTTSKELETINKNRNRKKGR